MSVTFAINGIKCKKCGGPHKTITHFRGDNDLADIEKTKKKPFKTPLEPPEFNGHKEIFNLDAVKIKKLNKFIEINEARKNHVQRLNAYKLEGETKDQAIIRKIEEISQHKKREFVNLRLKESGVLVTTLYAKQGDEFLLRRQLETGLYQVDERDPRTGRTMLVEAVAGVGLFFIT